MREVTRKGSLLGGCSAFGESYGGKACGMKIWGVAGRAFVVFI